MNCAHDLSDIPGTCHLQLLNVKPNPRGLTFFQSYVVSRTLKCSRWCRVYNGDVVVAVSLVINFKPLFSMENLFENLTFHRYNEALSLLNLVSLSNTFLLTIIIKNRSTTNTRAPLFGKHCKLANWRHHYCFGSSVFTL